MSDEKAKAAAAAKAKAAALKKMKEKEASQGASESSAQKEKEAPTADAKAKAAAAAKAKAAAAAKAKAAAASKASEGSEDVGADAKAKAAAAAKAKAAAAAKAKAAANNKADVAGDDDAKAKAKAAAVAKAKAAAAAKAKAAAGGSGGDDEKAKAKAAAVAKAKAAAAAKAKGAGGKAAAEPVEKEEEPSPNQPVLDKYVKVIHENLGEDALEDYYINKLSKDVPTLVAKADTYYKVAQFLKHNEQLAFDYLSNSHGSDFETHMENYNHLYSYKNRQSVALKVKIDRDKPEIDSLTSLWEGANWPERETYDLLGIVFTNHPNLTRIMMPDDWIGHPLRKDYVPHDEEL